MALPPESLPRSPKVMEGTWEGALSSGPKPCQPPKDALSIKRGPLALEQAEGNGSYAKSRLILRDPGQGVAELAQCPSQVRAERWAQPSAPMGQLWARPQPLALQATALKSVTLG